MIGGWRGRILSVRQKLGFVTAGVVIAAAVGFWFAADTLINLCWRLGVVLVLAWVAEPQLRRLPKWTLGALLATLVIAVWRPKTLLLVLPALCVAWLLRPRRPYAQRR